MDIFTSLSSVTVIFCFIVIYCLLPIELTFACNERAVLQRETHLFNLKYEAAIILFLMTYLSVTWNDPAVFSLAYAEWELNKASATDLSWKLVESEPK